MELPPRGIPPDVQRMILRYRFAKNGPLFRSLLNVLFHFENRPRVQLEPIERTMADLTPLLEKYHLQTRIELIERDYCGSMR
jgi:hypothetical protein